MLIISSRTAACVLVLMLMHELGALFECCGCVPLHIRKERLQPKASSPERGACLGDRAIAAGDRPAGTASLTSQNLHISIFAFRPGAVPTQTPKCLRKRRECAKMLKA